LLRYFLQYLVLPVGTMIMALMFSYINVLTGWPGY